MRTIFFPLTYCHSYKILRIPSTCRLSDDLPQVKKSKVDLHSNLTWLIQPQLSPFQQHEAQSAILFKVLFHARNHTALKILIKANLKSLKSTAKLHYSNKQISPFVRNEQTITRFHRHIEILYIFQTGILDKINAETS